MVQTNLMTWIDYTIMISMLMLSSGFGFYHGIKKNRTSSIEEYLFAGRNLPLIPLIMSNMASSVSSIAIVAVSRETYYYGAQILFLSIGQLFGFVCFYFFYVPVFYELKYTSYFEYLEKRFNKAIRLLGSGVFIICQIIHSVTIMYSACIAVTKVIPVPFYLLATVLCSICSIYTFLGGLRGVVWSDFIQALFMYGSAITIIVISINNVGGINQVLDIAREGGRLQFLNFDPHPFSRHSSWTLWLTGLCLSLQIICTNPGIIQRCLAISTYKKVKIVVISSAIAHFALFTTCVLIGLLIYTNYYNCDPVMSKELTDADQLVTYHVLKIGSQMPGLSGIFLAGILSASLSSLSTTMNSLSGIVFEDFIKTFAPFTLNNARTNLCLKSIVVLLGLIVNAGIFAMNPSGGLFQTAATLSSFGGGLIIFIISFGLFVRNANTKGVIVGALVGSSVTLCIIIGNVWSVAAGKIKYTPKIVSIESCVNNISHPFENLTQGFPHHTSVTFDEDVPYLFRISFGLFAPIGVVVSFIVGYLITICTKHNKNIDENLLIPQIRKKMHDYDAVTCKVNDI
ncbi:sodium-coupled monocarboxylate transporter 2-like [Rhodnius prolixus]|uniref:sodium-coupled monocarboxylate transporter 2-like n=1 Tax=Rhodnius prolixus TaxID=13249 RepID=UPI003D18D867